jgi:aspartate 1-decarboxylase
MRLTMCKSKIHRATVTRAELNYEGSITIDQDLLRAADILPFEKVQVVNVNNGERLETYVYAGPAGSGVICLNGAAARLAQPGDKIIVISYADMEREEAERHSPRLVLVDDANHVKDVLSAVAQPVHGNAHLA